MGWYRISEGGQIEAFDMTFKHWTWVSLHAYSERPLV